MPTDLSAILARGRAADPRALGRLISLVEDADPALRPIVAALATEVGHARVIGITGAPGVGKSSLVAALIGALRTQGKRVAVLAVDPSSPFSGGAVLGDRIRMQAHALDTGVYIRSMASRGRLGGVSAGVPLALRVLDGAGFDTVLLETVGIGQSEIEVATIADITVVLLAPGMGDGVQTAKAGVLEIADVFVVNKADREGAQGVLHDLRSMIGLAEPAAGSARPAIVPTVAIRGDGVDELLRALDAFWTRATESGLLGSRRLERARREVEGVAFGLLQDRLTAEAHLTDGSLAARVRDGELDPFAAAEHLLAAHADRRGVDGAGPGYGRKAPGGLRRDRVAPAGEEVGAR